MLARLQTESHWSVIFVEYISKNVAKIMLWIRLYYTSSLWIRTLKHREVRLFAQVLAARKYHILTVNPGYLVCDLNITYKFNIPPIPYNPGSSLNSFKKHISISTTIWRWLWKIHFTFIVKKKNRLWKSKKILTVRKHWKYGRLWIWKKLSLILPTSINHY